jgi:hypothetical protein
MFAFRAGIISSDSISGGIVADDQDAYALILSGGNDELPPLVSDGPLDSPEHFTFLCGNAAHTPEIWRLIAPAGSRRGWKGEERGIRVLRTDGGGFWAPGAGIRYDGLYVVTHYSGKRVTVKRSMFSSTSSLHQHHYQDHLQRASHRPRLYMPDKEDDTTRLEFRVHFSRLTDPAENLGDVFSRP